MFECCSISPFRCKPLFAFGMFVSKTFVHNSIPKWNECSALKKLTSPHSHNIKQTQTRAVLLCVIAIFRSILCVVRSFLNVLMTHVISFDYNHTFAVVIAVVVLVAAVFLCLRSMIFLYVRIYTCVGVWIHLLMSSIQIQM